MWYELKAGEKYVSSKNIWQIRVDGACEDIFKNILMGEKLRACENIFENIELRVGENMLLRIFWGEKELRAGANMF